MTADENPVDPNSPFLGLLILDFDGVVADSEVISLTTLQNALSAHGVALPLADVRRRFLGKAVTQIRRQVEGENPGTDWDGFARHWHAALFDQFRTGLAPLPGLVQLLDRIDARRLPYCIASSGSMQRIGVALDAMGLKARFSHVFSAEQVTHGKPAPDLFLHAAKTVGVAPDRCLVLEDSPSGIKAARAAGMRAFGFVGGTHLEGVRANHRAELVKAGAHDVLKHLGDLTFDRMRARPKLQNAD